VLGGDIKDSSDLAQNGFVAVPVLVTLDDHHAVEEVQGEVESRELFRPLTTELDDGLSVRGVSRGDKKLVQPLLPLLPPLIGPAPSGSVRSAASDGRPGRNGHHSPRPCRHMDGRCRGAFGGS
jgi:hypothetical protein